jgi:hypothetical protein
MKKHTLLLIGFLPLFINAQSLSIDRINKIKNATVRILLADGSSGTGFLIGDKGTIATCWHVIDTAYKAHVQVAILDRNGKPHSAKIDTIQRIDTCKKYDFGILHAIGLIKTPFLNLGSFDSAE